MDEKVTILRGYSDNQIMELQKLHKELFAIELELNHSIAYSEDTLLKWWPMLKSEHVYE